jgi:hypothetical protein
MFSVGSAFALIAEGDVLQRCCDTTAEVLRRRRE